MSRFNEFYFAIKKLFNYFFILFPCGQRPRYLSIDDDDDDDDDDYIQEINFVYENVIS
jgi:hypothetical protein